MHTVRTGGPGGGCDGCGLLQDAQVVGIVMLQAWSLGAVKSRQNYSQVGH